MAYTLGNKCAKNCCKRIILVQFIVEDVVTLFLRHSVGLSLYKTCWYTYYLQYTQLHRCFMFYLFSHLTYLLQLLYLRKLSRLKYHEFSLSQCSNARILGLNAKLSLYYFS